MVHQNIADRPSNGDGASERAKVRTISLPLEKLAIVLKTESIADSLG